MQGHRSSSLTTLPENLSFDHGSTDTSIDSQLPWNTIHPSAPNRLPVNDTNTQFFSHLRHNGHHSQWSLGEASSSASQNHAYGNEGKIEQHARSLHSPLENNNDVSLNGPHTTNGSFLLQNSTSEAISQDLNMNSTFDENEDDDCQIVEHPNTYISSNEDTSRRISCKRKALEVQVGQSSASASSSSFQNIERSQSQYQPIAPNNIITPTQTQTEQANPRLRLGVGGNPFSLTNLESSGRNLRVRINSLPHQEPPLATNPFLGEAEMGNRDVSSSSSRYSARLLRNHLLDVNPVPSMENGIPLDQYTPLRRNSQTRWSRGSSSRTSRASIPAISEPALTSIPIPRTISEHPIFIPPPANEMGSSSEHNTSWNLVGGGNNGNIGNAVSAPGTGSSSRPGSGSVGNISAADWARRYRQNYPRRLSEIARRSQLSSAGTESGLGGTNHGTGSSSSLTPQEMALLSGSHSHDRHAPSARAAMLERNVDGALGLPYSLRTFAAGSEGRSSIMSEQIRHVLNLMRRGEGLRIEDVMLLDHSVFFGMADINDRHRDMRLDVDNMSYEELLALEERIGNVSTGLSEEAIINGLKQHNYYLDNKGSTRDQVETEPCSICREEYNDGEDLGRLECGHDFHRDCIKQWLVQKNSCPICKKAGLST